MQDQQQTDSEKLGSSDRGVLAAPPADVASAHVGKKRRYVIEGEWSGYRSSQQRIVHRTVHSGSFKKLREWAEKNFAIHFTDGTSLYLTVRDAKPRERVQVINGYGGLIADCAMYGVNSVAALYAARAALAKAGAA